MNTPQITSAQTPLTKEKWNRLRVSDPSRFDALPSSLLLYDPKFSEFSSVATIEGIWEEFIDESGKVIREDAVFHYDPTEPQAILQAHGNPLEIDHFVITELNPFSWRAGQGWPLWTSVDPVGTDADASFLYPQQHRFAFVIGAIRSVNNGYRIWASRFEVGNHSTIFVAVNDQTNGYGDNTGQIDVHITAWS